MKEVKMSKEEYTDIVRTEGAVAILSAIVTSTYTRVIEGKINSKELIDAIVNTREDFVNQYISKLEKVGWTSESNNIQWVQENTIIKEDD